MDCVVPVELANIIYLERAMIRLKNKLEEYDIDFDRLKLFLEEYDGYIMGSLVLGCFDTEFTPGDMDIFVHKKSEDWESIPKGSKIWKEFFKLFKTTNVNIVLYKNPIYNPIGSLEFEDKFDTVDYNYQFYTNERKIDLVLWTNRKPERAKSIECSQFIFDGTKFVLPQTILTNIQKFLEEKVTTFGSFDGYFSEIYDPWGLYTMDEMKKCVKNLCLKETPIKPLSKLYQIIYDTLSPFYAKTSELGSDNRYMYMLEDDYSATELHIEYFPKEFDFDAAEEEVAVIMKDDLPKSEIGVIWDVLEYAHPKLIKLVSASNTTSTNLESFKRAYTVYRCCHRLLKYIARGYTFSDIGNLLNMELINSLM